LSVPLISDLFDIRGSLTRVLDEDACIIGLCQTDTNTGLCYAVHRGQFVDIGDKTAFRLTMIDDLHDDRMGALWDEDAGRERRLRAAKIGYDTYRVSRLL